MRALVLSGGGSRGAFHVGFLRRTVGELGTHYPILCGVSVGALVASFLAMYRKGEEAAAVAELEALFLNVKNADVWRRWFPFGKVSGLWKSSLLDSSPLHAMVRKRLDAERVRTSGKKLRIGAVALGPPAREGKAPGYHVLDETFVPLADAVLGSAAFPGFYTPIRARGQWWVDGGVQAVTPIKAAIDAGATSIDVVVTEPADLNPGFEAEPEALDVLLRSLELMTHRLTWVDVRQAQAVNALIRAGAAPGKREIEIRVAHPSGPFPGSSFEFDPHASKDVALAGYEAAVRLEAEE